ncbi:hypothetical protein M5K25_023594 [Dendrobium thyrsiflorum]|uniref:Uncharacterized protein n=1 Tax=Dendrobium thyrsiflorum TaxID=117978 RepID=A0ABD0U8E5_DENTH
MSPNQGPEALLEGSNHNLSYQTVSKWDKSINRALISPRRGPKRRRRRREEKKERREETPPRPPPDCQATPEFRPASKRRQSSARPPSDAGLPPGLQVTPDFRLASKSWKKSVSKWNQEELGVRLATERGNSTAYPLTIR